MSNEEILKDALLEVLHVIHTDGFYSDTEFITDQLNAAKVDQKEIDYSLR